MEIENKEIRLSEAGEKLIGVPFKVLDKGFVKLVSYHGTDQLVEAAARVSYQKGTRSVSDTRNLIRYLYRNQHASPFELCNCTFQFKMPLYVIQQLLRHRTARLNQESHRYSEISYEKEVASKWRSQSTNNKQGSSGLVTDWPEGVSIKSFGDGGYAIDGLGGLIPCPKNATPESFLSNEELKLHSKLDEIYKTRLKLGVAKEQARKDIPHSMYSQMYWQSDLRNLLHFLGLRCDSHAQLEIRQYAYVIAGIVKELYPLSFEAWYDYQFTASVWTRLDKELFQLIGKHYGWNLDSLKNTEKTKILADKVGMSSRELDEFWQKLEVEEKDFTLDYNNLYEKLDE